ncbi:MAG: hypothetical protein ACRBDI_07190 [Alphaproteobacteria bacterium]
MASPQLGENKMQTDEDVTSMSMESPVNTIQGANQASDALAPAAADVSATAPAADQVALDAETQRQQQEANARLALDSVGLQDFDFDLLEGIDIAALIKALFESIMDGNNMMDAFKNSVAEVANDLKNKPPEAETPEGDDPQVAEAEAEETPEEETPAAETQVAETPATAAPPAQENPQVAETAPEAQQPEQEEPRGYVNEGQGPLLTNVNKPEDQPVSPLIAIAMGQDVPDGQSILSVVFENNSTNQVGDASVTQIPFRAEPPVVDPVATPMEIAAVVDTPAANADDYDQSAPKALGMGS